MISEIESSDLNTSYKTCCFSKRPQIFKGSQNKLRKEHKFPRLVFVYKYFLQGDYTEGGLLFAEHFVLIFEHKIFKI